MLPHLRALVDFFPVTLSLPTNSTSKTSKSDRHCPHQLSAQTNHHLLASRRYTLIATASTSNTLDRHANTHPRSRKPPTRFHFTIARTAFLLVLAMDNHQNPVHGHPRDADGNHNANQAPTVPELQQRIQDLRAQNDQLEDVVSMHLQTIFNLQVQVNTQQLQVNAAHQQANALHQQVLALGGPALEAREHAMLDREAAIHQQEYNLEQRETDVRHREIITLNRELAVTDREAAVRGGSEPAAEEERPRKKPRLTHGHPTAQAAMVSRIEDWRANVAEPSEAAAPPPILPHFDPFAGVGKAPVRTETAGLAGDGDEENTGEGVDVEEVEEETAEREGDEQEGDEEGDEEEGGEQQGSEAKAKDLEPGNEDGYEADAEEEEDGGDQVELNEH